MYLYDRCHALPKKTLDIITSEGNNAIIQIKGNQDNLFKTAKFLTTTKLAPASIFSHQGKKERNRIECREASVFQVPQFSFSSEWEGMIKAIIRVRRYIDRFDTKKKKWMLTTEVSYYGATCMLEAEKAAEIIRSHWHIENKNHYVRDVSLGEDASRIRVNPGVFARLRSFALNLLRKNKVKNIKGTLFENALNFENLLNYKGLF